MPKPQQPCGTGLKARGRPVFKVYATTDEGPPWRAELAGVWDAAAGAWVEWHGQPLAREHPRALWALKTAVDAYRREVHKRRRWMCSRCGYVWTEWRKPRVTKRCKRCSRYFAPYQRERGPKTRQAEKVLVAGGDDPIAPAAVRREENLERVRETIRSKWKLAD
jgi:hypothetical protein